MSRLIRAILLTALLASCATGQRGTPQPTSEPTPTPPDLGLVSRDMMGPDWPFMIESGVVRCVPVNEVVMRGSDGMDYALNGSARGEDFWADGTSILRQGKLPADLGPIIALGLSLCED